jgi:predicted nucleotidyltransferase
MRLSKEQTNIIKKAVKENFGENAVVYLFGSRTDDKKMGGDIDLYIETDKKKDLLEKKIKMLVQLHKNLGEQKIDIILNNFRGVKYIYEVARREGILL